MFYQFVSRGLIANTPKSYGKLGDVVNDARLAGMIDWDRITDRTRNLKKLNHWEHPGEIISDASRWYNVDLWGEQDYRPEVWIEKDALVGVFEGVCTNNDVPYFSCRGYTSQSEMWAAGQRILEYLRSGKKAVIFHFGDHDPSGIDMSRDIEDRLMLFLTYHWAFDNGYDMTNAAERQNVIDDVRALFEIRRIALNMAQIEQYGPPPNPVKQTDSRWVKYVEEYDVEQSWELDALDPATLAGLTLEAIKSVRKTKDWNRAIGRENSERDLLKKAADNWNELQEQLKEKS